MANVEIDGVNSKVYTDQVDPKTGTTLTLGTSGDTVSIPSGVTITNSGTDGGGFGITSASFLPNAAPLIINGNMAISQRATSVTSVSTSKYTTCDRYYLQLNSNTAVYTVTQESLTSGDAFADGFSKSFKVDVTTADASLASGEYAQCNYCFEGQDVQMFKKGTANAETYTLSFWIKATKTGTNVVQFYDQDNARHICAQYTVSSTDTWEKKVLNFAADTTGAITNDNSCAFKITWWLMAGSSFTSGTLPTAWQANVDADSAVGQINNADSTSNNWEITGIQLEVGTYTSSDLPPFRHESYGDNLRRCQRYLYKHLNGADDYETVGIGCYRRTDMGEVFIYPPVTMRTDPTLSTVSGTNYFEFDWDGAPDYSNDLTLIRSSPNAQCLYSTSFSGTLGLSVECMTTDAAARVNFDAELS